MSRTLASVLFLWILVPQAWAQDTVVMRLQGRADSLLRAWREAQAIANVADSLERDRATAGRDTIAVGHLRIIANRSPLPLRKAAERAWPAIDSLYGNAAADLAYQRESRCNRYPKLCHGCITLCRSAASGAHDS